MLFYCKIAIIQLQAVSYLESFHLNNNIVAFTANSSQVMMNKFNSLLEKKYLLGLTIYYNIRTHNI